MMYRAIAEGLNKRILVKESELMDKLSELYQEKPNKDFYVSVFKYNDKHKERFEKTKSLSGIDDNVSNIILFDFDDQDLSVAKRDTITVVKRLIELGFKSEDISIYFSGGKGHHIEINTTSEFKKDELVNIRSAIAGDLTTTDPVIKDNQRIIRAVLSKHPTTGLYKIPLTVAELETMSIDDIKKESANPSDIRYSMASEMFEKKVAVPAKIKKLGTVKPKEVTVKVSDETIDFSKNKTGLTNAKYALAQGYFDEGERHEAVMILASTYMSLGWPQDLCYNNLKATLRLRNARLGRPAMSDVEKAELWKEVESVFSPTWKGGVYSEDKNELLIKTKRKYGITDKYENTAFISIPEVDDVFKDFASNIDKNTLKLGIESFDKEIRVTTSTLVMLLAPPATGKTSLTFGILNATSNQGIKSMFFSLDMAAPQAYQRLAQRHTGLHSDKIFEAYKNNNTSVINTISDTLGVEYKNVKFCFRGAMSIETIRENILKQKEIQGEFPKLVVIDYLESITTSFSDSSASKAFAARALKDMANEFGICIFLLVQPRLSGGDGSTELNSYTDIKGSSVLSECASQIFSMYRPGFNPKNSADDNFISITVVKNRMGQLGRFDYHWTGLTGAIRELTQEERADLKSLLEQKAAEKKGLDDL